MKKNKNTVKIIRLYNYILMHLKRNTEIQSIQVKLIFIISLRFAFITRYISTRNYTYTYAWPSLHDIFLRGTILTHMRAFITRYIYTRNYTYTHASLHYTILLRETTYTHASLHYTIYCCVKVLTHMRAFITRYCCGKLLMYTCQ